VRHPSQPVSAAVIGQNTLDDNPVASMSAPIGRFAPVPAISFSRI
jgi:hypothetical protein